MGKNKTHVKVEKGLFYFACGKWTHVNVNKYIKLIHRNMFVFRANCTSMTDTGFKRHVGHVNLNGILM